MDTSENTIVVGILLPGEEAPVLDRVWNEEDSVRHLAGRLGPAGQLRACYEAGPCGFELHRLLTSMGVSCDVGRAVVDPAPARGAGQDRPA